MIPEIGVLIAAYVITRMLALMYTPPTSRGRTIVGAAAGVTIAIAVFVAMDLIRTGTELSERFRALGFR